MLSASRKGPAYKPQLRVCYLCGQQFGSASIAIHIPQCYAKKVSQWEIADPATRGRRPKHPDSVNWKGEGMSKDRLNDEQFHEFTENLVPCRNCGRKFLPDRLVVHLRSCKGDNGRGMSVKGGGGGGRSMSETMNSTQGTTRRSMRSTPSARSQEKNRSRSPSRSAGYKPQLPICYLCGQQFGTTSIGIHVPQCYAKKLAQWEVADVHTRGKPPKHPDSVNWKGEGHNVEEYNDAQFAEFVSNLEPCPNCGRRFLADRLVVHLRSCKPGSAAKPPPTATRTATTTTTTSATATIPAPTITPSSVRNSDSRPSTSRQSTAEGGGPTKDLGKVNPKLRRLPKDGKVDPEGRKCSRCNVVEYDVSAKFCRECGAGLACQNAPNPCVHCGENIPEGSRFCGTCGVPINGAAASERTAGAENANAPTVRVVVCPACRAVCDADGNFCDNCGAALGDAEPSTSVTPTKEVMFCKKCGELVEDDTAKFCEECGGVLEKMTVNADSTEPDKILSTLSPDNVKKYSVAGKTTALPRVASSTPAGKAGSLATSALSGDSTGANTNTSTVKLDAAKKSTVSSDAQNVRKGPQNAKAQESPALPRIPKGSEPRNNYDDPQLPDGYEENDAIQREECSNCGRMFAIEALARHERVCAAQKQRKVFNMRARRLLGTGAEKIARSSGSSSSAPQAPRRDWRAESEAFRRSLREARQVDKVLKAGGNARDLPPPTYSENSHYTPCPHCGRKFAPDVAERHIPRCATTVNRPKPPPRRR